MQQKGAGKRGGQSAFVRPCHLFPQVTDSYTSPCMPELSSSTGARAVTVQHRPSTKEQDTAAPDIWSIKEDQEKKTAFVSLIAMPLAGARRHHNIWLP